MDNKFKKFLQGMLAAAIGGAVIGTAGIVADPTADYSKLGTLAGAGAASTAIAYYLNSPFAPKRPKQPKPMKPPKHTFGE